MKCGDLFCCIYAHESNLYKVGRWVEKSLLTNFRPEQYLNKISKKELDKKIKGKIIDGASK